VILEGVNVAKRHAKPTRATQQGGVIDKFMPVHVSSVALWCKSHDGPARAGMKIDERRRKGARLPQVRGRAVSTVSAARPPRLKERYLTESGPSSRTSWAGQRHGGSRLEKIVINMGVGGPPSRPRSSRGPSATWRSSPGQKPIVTRAKQSIAGFKLREGQAIGAKVTLRGDRAWEFFDRLLSLAIPRIRDFRGLSPRRSTARATTPSGSPSS
jgi:large subunit ribosomal protein L5